MRLRRLTVVPMALGLLFTSSTAALAEDPPPPEPAAQCQRLGVIGDSLMVGSKKTLATELATVGVTELRLDAQVARRIPSTVRAPYSGVKALRALRASGYQMDCYLVGLGTNDVGIALTATKYQTWIRELMTEIGDHPVLWVNVARPKVKQSTDLFNQTLTDMVGEFPNLQVADWASIMPDHLDWFVADKVHLRLPGRIFRGQWMAQQVFNRLFAAAPEPLGPTCSITKSLKWKMQNADVACLETRLVQLGYALAAPDNVFDMAIYRAVVDFQKAKGITPNGIVRAQTTAALGLTPPPPG